MPSEPDPVLERWRLRIGVVGIVVAVAYMAFLPMLAG
jgi:hypothetical protein